jgi:hypothetical protein
MLTELIKRDIRGISPGRFPVVGKNDEVEGRSVGQIEFVTTAGLETDSLRLRRLGYALLINERREKILVRKESTDLNGPLKNGARVFEISRIVDAFQVEFSDGTDWVTAWDSTGTGTLPKEIRVTIDVSDAKGNIRRFTAEESIQSTLQ